MGMHNRVTKSSHLLDVNVSPTEPAARANGDALQVDDLWRDTGSSPQTWNVWDGAVWQPMGGSGSATGSSYVPVSNGDPDAPAYLFAPDGAGLLVEWP